MDLVNASLPWVAGILAVAAFVVVRIGGTSDIHQSEPDSVPGWGVAYSDDLRGVQADGGLGGGALYLAAVSPVAEPPAPVVGEPQLQAPDEPEVSAEPPPAPVVIPSTPIEQLVCSYAWDCGTALRVMWCESGGRPSAVGGGANYGLFQINQIHASRFPGFWERWMIPEYNVEYAWAIYSGRGWSAWSCH